MRILFFVRDGCKACKTAKEKVSFFLSKWGVADTLETATINVSTVDGLTEAAMMEVGDIPTIILEESGSEIARWVKTAPLSRDLKEKLGV